jgi:Asp/Glu/hydantoin racemase
MSDNSGMAAVDQAAATITNAEHAAALVAAREEGRKAGMATSAAAIDAARADGAKAARERLAGIEAAALPGHDALVASCKADPACTPGDAALRINAAERAKLGAAGAAIANVETATGRVSAAVTTSAGAPAAVPQTADGWKAEWSRSEALQAEFPSAEHYANYQAGVKAGRIRVLKAAPAA